MNVKFKSLVAVLAALFISACDAPTGTSGTQSSQGGISGGPVTPGSQEDLAQNVGDRVFFAYDSAVLSSEGQQALERQAAWLKQYATVGVTIEGHCDERGTREYNLALGERRAAAVKKYLVGLGIAANRVSTISYGKERPAVVGDDESAWSQNRRGVTVVTNQ